ncbi:nestin-like [Asterias rubens]|uniref:nestin-like n=1 Tax=Asterias rubens TaxID=7604 RepID=UPI0014555697|nr:nestin-like [Asterias rubens]XP_033631203.1 nestin-like [Asterias rubens]XP_033631205.1 nestin-like [Asterias rubens]
MGNKLDHPDVQLSSEKFVIVTGGNAGIGFETAKSLAAMGARVCIACRSEEKAKAAIERMQSEHHAEMLKKNPPSEENQTQPDSLGLSTEGDRPHEQLAVEFAKLDLSSLKSTMEFIEGVKQRSNSLNVLVCNAGIAFIKEEYTEDKFEKQFQVNYLSHLLIIFHLLPLLHASAPDARIVLLSSTAHSLCDLDFQNMQGGRKSYSRFKVYGSSKGYMIMAAHFLARRLEGSKVTTYSVDPGGVDTQISNNFSDLKVFNFLAKAIGRLGFLRTPKEGASTSIVACVDPALNDSTGVFLKDCKPASHSSFCGDQSNQESLWTYSLQCLEQYISDAALRAAFPLADQALLTFPKDVVMQDGKLEEVSAEAGEERKQDGMTNTLDQEKSKDREPPSRTFEDGEVPIESKLEDKPAFSGNDETQPARENEDEMKKQVGEKEEKLQQPAREKEDDTEQPVREKEDETQQPAIENENGTQQPAREKEDETQQPARGKENETQQPAREKEDEMQQPAREKEDETQQPAREKEDETQQPAREKEDETQQPAREKEDETQQPVREKEDETQQPVRENEDETQQPAREKEDETQQPARENEDETQQPAREKEDETQQPVREKEDETQQPAREKEDEMQQPAREKEDETQQPSREKEDETQQPAREKEDETQQPAGEEEDETQQPAREKEDETQQPSREKEDETQQPAREKEDEMQQPAGEEDDETQQPAREKEDETQQPAGEEEDETQQPAREKEDETHQPAREKEDETQ